MTVAPQTIYAAAATTVATGGTAIIAVFGGFQGGRITNPVTALNQGVATVEPLYVDPTGPPGLMGNTTTVVLQPGQSYHLIPGATSNVWVNAQTSGHSFSAFVIQSAPIYPPTPTPGPFPPVGPVTVQGMLSSYLYTEYNDDEDLQAFVTNYNLLAQQTLD